MKHLGEVKTFLGYEVIRNRSQRTVFVTQERYTRSLISKFGYEGLHGVKSPWPPNFVLEDGDLLPNEGKPYLKKTGSVNYLSTGTRPDITYTVNRLCEGNAKPTNRHLELMKHLFRYLIHTAELGILLGGKPSPGNDNVINLRLRAYADASFADEKFTRHSTGGHVVFLGAGPVYWKSKKQAFVTLSTTEAEHSNLTPAAISALWISGMLAELGAPQPAPSLIYTDSKNARHQVMNPQVAARNRCIDVRYKWLIEQVQQGKFTVTHIPGDEMIADGFTKPLNAEKHGKFVKMLGLASRNIVS
ncbi:hypothetical protein QBC45DRAFT_456675 [Copromyces sp. CBS 386.78]|nr:hypothetical protein QBC45DRAFT_456675 [Copromyces sp. CBS 386.78]